MRETTVSSRQNPRERRERRLRTQRKALRKGNQVDISRISRRVAGTEHDRQNATKRAPGPLGTRGGGRPAGPYGSMADTIHWEESKGVLVAGRGLMVARFLRVAYEEAPEIRWYAPDAPSASTWAALRQQGFRSGEYLADRGMAGDVSRGLENAYPRPDITLRFENEGKWPHVAIELNDSDGVVERAAATRAARQNPTQRQQRPGQDEADDSPDEGTNRIPTNPYHAMEFMRQLVDHVEDLLAEM